MSFNVGDIVEDLFNINGPKARRLGKVKEVNSKKNDNKEWVHLIEWDDGEIRTYHPINLRKLSKLESFTMKEPKYKASQAS